MPACTNSPSSRTYLVCSSIGGRISSCEKTVINVARLKLEILRRIVIEHQLAQVERKKRGSHGGRVQTLDDGKVPIGLRSGTEHRGRFLRQFSLRIPNLASHSHLPSHCRIIASHPRRPWHSRLPCICTFLGIRIFLAVGCNQLAVGRNRSCAGRPSWVRRHQ